jgi:hypothetical protein
MAQEQAGKGRDLARLLALPEPDHRAAREVFRHRFLSLALEAYRREAITRSKLAELAANLMESSDAQLLIDEFGADDSEGLADVLLPAE